MLSIFLLFVALSWFGYFGYLRYAASNITKIALLPPLVFYSFAFFAGIVSFFAPCAIGILPAYLSYYLNIEESDHKKAIYYGNIAGLGLISFYLVLGVLTVIFGQIVGMKLMIFNREISVIILLVVGIFLLFNTSVSIKKIIPLPSNYLSTRSLNKINYEKGVFLFGVFYGLEAFMCAFLLMVPLIIHPLLGGDILTSIVSFIIFSFALGLCMVITTILISRSRRILTETFMATTKSLKTIAGVVMIMTAVYILYTIISLPMLSIPTMTMKNMKKDPHQININAEKKK